MSKIQSPPKNYQWVLFDADETLFSFDNFKGLQHLFSGYGINFTEADFQSYQPINKALWVAYEQGKTTPEEIKTKRFEAWANRLNVAPMTLNDGYIQSMIQVSDPLDGALELMNFLQLKQVNVAIITNGFTDIQTPRLKRTNFESFIKFVVVSEEVGVAKPHSDIFTEAFNQITQHDGQVPDLSNILMVGDNLYSDILGGNRIGIDTCWINPHDKVAEDDIKPTYMVKNLAELQAILNV